MNKLVSLSAAAMIVLGCSNIFREELAELHSEIDDLKEQITKINGSIDALQTIVTALEAKDYVSSITAISEDGKVIGYTLHFDKSGDVSIYHGENGHTPEISVHQDTDGEWYWTIDGEWMLTSSGERIRATAIDGATPQLKIEGDYWYVSYDNGTTWTKLCQANYHGEDGHSPEVSVRQDSDGQWYWTVDGEWMLTDSGERIRATAIDGETPQLKIEEDYWWVSYNNGATWTKLCQANYHGEDGHSPEVSVRQDSDGQWYWTIDGEWMLNDSGEKVRAGAKDGTTPQLKIEEDYWWVSYDDGATWSKLSQAIVKGDSIFENVDVRNTSYVELTLTDGTVLRVPRYSPIQISFETDEEETAIGAGETISIRYRVSGGASKLLVTVSSDGYFKTSITPSNDYSGVIKVTCPTTYVNGYINVLVSDMAQHTVVKVIQFYERRIYFDDGLTYRVGPYGGTVTVPYSYNFEHTIAFESGCDEWIKMVSTKADMLSETLQFEVAPNTLESVRVGYINILPITNSSVPYAQITIIQSSAYFTIDQSGFTVPSIGEMIEVNMTSTRGVKVDIPAEATWLSGELENEGESYKLKVKVERNYTDSDRSVEIPVYTGDGETVQGKIIIHQLSEDMDSIMDMVIEVSANEINRSTVYLPLAGECHCYVDWGDGTMDHIDKNIDANNSDQYIKHEYKEYGYYKVRIAGSVYALSSFRMPDRNAIRAVLQWGNLGLVKMEQAFLGCSSLKYVAGDTVGAFTKVKRFNESFKDCTTLDSVSEDLFSKAVDATEFVNTFNNCKHLADIPEDLFYNNTKAKSFGDAFNSCSSIVSLPAGLFRGNPEVTDFSATFIYCSSLSSLPGEIFSSCPEVASFAYCFRGCLGLKIIPVSLFDNNRRVTVFHQTFCFDGNHSSQESPYTVIDGVKYHLYDRWKAPDHFVTPTYYTECFYDCIFMDSIPSDW